MIRLGLTGSIASGKSTALAAFAALGLPTLSADAVVHELYAGAAVAPLGAVFPGVIHGGKVDRTALSARLMAHPEDIGKVEAIVHPLVRRRFAAFVDQASADGAPMAVLDIPLLYETGHDYGLDRVAVTSVDDATLRRRALGRPGMTVEKLDTILARQMPQDEKRRRADFVIDTSGSLDDTRGQVAALVERLLAGASGTR